MCIGRKIDLQVTITIDRGPWTIDHGPWTIDHGLFFKNPIRQDLRAIGSMFQVRWHLRSRA
ncbi:MAG: hypothetical protein EAZ70_09030 [Runella slithyformis]|nr:MAG: hypothetical protein EAY79_09870 [Runella slithyformis]TAE97052.1 MAG: hypothetical protein EAZ80_07800 [Runella slithyformis]TAF26154.1 MAG: hypothetical protein EAZ70_09030 [Runella slithyformis]TAF47498.1 MAG: hypothetical protein EAZ63_07740 [Runella slithyformis]TAF80346.1 MAG: hypothetical protein EAZ50_09020 [Runella slithyformis]